MLLALGDSVTTDHISPAGSIAASSPAGRYLQEHGVAPVDFNSYGSRRGNDRVMTRGTFANIRIRNLLAPGTEGGVTRHLPDGRAMTVYDAAMQYKAEGVPLVVFAGEEYGAGSSRDWAAKGTYLLGVRAVLAASFERIHRSNLVGMGVLPLELPPGQTWQSLGLTGEETFDIPDLGDALQPRAELTVVATAADGSTRQFPGPGAHRHARRVGILPPRRHFAGGVAEAGGKVEWRYAKGRRLRVQGPLSLRERARRRELPQIRHGKPVAVILFRNALTPCASPKGRWGEPYGPHSSPSCSCWSAWPSAAGPPGSCCGPRSNTPMTAERPRARRNGSP